jgi:hypothetical protein
LSLTPETLGRPARHLERRATLTAGLSACEFAGHHLVVITRPGAGNRVYASDGVRFALELDAGEVRLPRVAARRAFWFGWYAQFRDRARSVTRLASIAGSSDRMERSR